VKRILEEPLLHFLVLGAALFVVYHYMHRGAPPGDPSTIVVNRDKLLTYMQYRSRRFDQKKSGAMLDTYSGPQLQKLIDGYVREEALYREARALQLGKHDYVARLRLIQQLKFINSGIVDSEVNPGKAEIRKYYASHRNDYAIPPTVSFTQVFFSRKLHGLKQAETLARRELAALNRDQVPPAEARDRGDRFPYQARYVDRDPDEITGYFGAAMQKRLFGLTPDKTRWQGPFRSPYGFHLVLLTRNVAGHIPPLDEIRERVAQDARHAARHARLEQTLRAIVDSYKVVVRPGIQEKGRVPTQHVSAVLDNGL